MFRSLLDSTRGENATVRSPFALQDADNLKEGRKKGEELEQGQT